MSKINTHTIPGFIELLPEEQLLFEWVKTTIEKSYRLFGFAPIDTPVIERAEVLLAKVGGETSKQIYKIAKESEEQALRFDLTVPLARYVAEHYAKLTFPFRRYHIAKVFRGERPQKGRYREFFQADIDIVGDGELSSANDAEIVAVINHIFKELGFSDYVIHINNRKILIGFLTALGKLQDATEILRIIDKVEKIGVDAVRQDLSRLGVDADTTNRIISLITLKGNSDEIFEKLEALNVRNDLFDLGLAELKEVSQLLQVLNVSAQNYMINLSIVRGLDYYTGTVYETILGCCPEIGSVCSGGRYDNLAECYTNRKLPGVGISIGLSRMFVPLLESGIFKTKRATPAEILVLPLGDNLKYAFGITSAIRSLGISAQIFIEPAKPKKKFAFADKQKFDFVIVVGEDEEKEHSFSLKNLTTGEQNKYSLDELETVIGKLFK